ncbi:hypothetical protein OKW30_006423 [Paraburkholderia sp. Clong3]|uniref:heparin lyase I family protein n=1 Tax=Paraburkholderia sp. Clong3 TaxID=2991061 RepID=UPI003D1FCC87
MKIDYQFRGVIFLLLISSASVFGRAGVAEAKEHELLHIGYESGNISPQSGVVAQKPKADDSINVDCSVSRAGKCSLKTILCRTDSYISYGRYRAETETSGLKSLLYSAGESYRYGFSFRTDNQWQYDTRESVDTVWQFKRFGTHADMFVAIKGHDVVLRVLKDGQYVIKKDFQPGKWMDIRIDVLWSDGANGMVVVYFREEGEKSYHPVVNFTGANMFNSTPKFARPKWGIYKPTFQKSYFDGPRIVFHDEIYIDKLDDLSDAHEEQ